MKTTFLILTALGLSTFATARDIPDAILRRLIATNIGIQAREEEWVLDQPILYRFPKFEWASQPANLDPSIIIPDEDRTSVICALRSIAAGKRALTGVEQQFTGGGIAGKLKKTGIPAELVRRSALVVLICLRDDHTIAEFVDDLATDLASLEWRLPVLESVAEPSIIPYLIPIVQKKDFAPRESERLLSGPSGIATELILRQIVNGREFTQRTRASARSLEQSTITREQVATRLLQWFNSNKDLFAEEEFRKVGVVWIPELDDPRTETEP